MKTLFIPAKAKLKIDKSKIISSSKKLPEKIAIVYSIQYIDSALEIKNILSKNHEIVLFVQVLGCTIPKFSKNTKGILLVGSGKFHAISLAHETKLPIYIVEDNSINQISKEEIEIFKKRKKASYLKYLNTEEVGILVSTKPGQENLKKAVKFKKKQKNKKSYLFISDTINTNEFENFGLTSWINTACPRLDMNGEGIVNLGDVN